MSIQKMMIKMLGKGVKFRAEIESTIIGLLDSELSNLASTVLKRHYGLAGYALETLEEIGKAQDLFPQGHAVSKMRVSQIESKALRKLRHPRNYEKYRKFLSPEFIDSTPSVERYYLIYLRNRR